MKKLFLLVLLVCTNVIPAESQNFITQLEGYGNDGQYDKADSIYKLASTQYSNQSIQKLELDVKYASYLDAQSKFGQAYSILQEAKERMAALKKTTDNSETGKKIQELEATATYEMAYGLWSSNKNQQARVLVTEAIEQATALNDSVLMAESYNLAGTIHRRLFMLDKAIALFQHALQITEERKDYALASIIISNISILYNEIEEPEKAVEISRKLFAYPDTDPLSLQHQTNRIILLCNHGILLTNAHLLQNARDTFLLAEKTMSAQTPEGLKFYVYTNCGRALRDAGTPQKAIRYYQQALSFRKYSRNPQHQANFDYLYGYALFHDTDSLAQACRYASDAVRFYRKDSLNMMLPKSLLLLSEIEARRHNLSTSAALAHEAYERELYLQKDKYHKRLAGFQAELETQEKDLEISRLNEKRTLEKITYQTRSYTISSILAFTLLLSVILIIHMRKRKIAFRLKQTELEGEIKQREAQSKLLISEMSKKMTDQYLNGLEDSNRRISRELHDGVCNELLAVSIQTTQITPQQLTAQINRIREDVRQLSHQLSSPTFSHISLYEMLHLYSDKLQTLESPRFQAYIADDIQHTVLSSEQILEVYRIVQEAVSNTIRHAHAKQMYLTVSRQDNEVEIIFEDDGIGFDSSLAAANKLTSGLGLKSVRERVHKLQGELQIETAHGKGTILHIQFPG